MSGEDKDGDDMAMKDSEFEESGLNSSSDSETLKKKRRTQTPSPTPTSSEYSVPASPPKFLSFEKLMSATKGFKNMTLAHEIAVDNDFKLEKFEPPENSLDQQVKKIIHKAFWDSLEERLAADPPDYSHALILLQEVKETLVSLLLPQHVRLKAQIEEVLDMDLIQQKMDQGIFDIFYYSGYVRDTMAKLCAPIRDERIEAIQNLTDIVPLFKEIFEVLELMKMDMANYTIQQMRPYIQQQSVQYERKKFEDLLKTQEEAGRDGLQFTKLWLQRSLRKLEEGGEGASAPTSITPALLLNQAYLELLEWDDNEVFPETLLMDQVRFLELRDRVKKLIVISSILLVTYHTVGTPIAGVQSLKQTLQSQIAVLLEGVPPKEMDTKILAVAEQVNKEIGETFLKLGFTAREKSQEDTLIGQIKDVLDEENTVHKVIKTRVFQFIQDTSFSRHSEPLKIPPGLSAVEKDLTEVCGQFLRLVAHNRSVFSVFYIDIVGALLKRLATDMSPVKPEQVHSAN